MSEREEVPAHRREGPQARTISHQQGSRNLGPTTTEAGSAAPSPEPPESEARPAGRDVDRRNPSREVSRAQLDF